mmetsp:Transcript_508/g.1557  ORF Transcript_508/g.1557 Transcript_508/m.1557 type:complete len:443 (+) Transcript_508:800-2128(+)
MVPARFRGKRGCTAEVRRTASDGGEHLARRGERLLDVLLGVGGAHEARLVLGRREVDAALEHAPVPPRELVRVGLSRVGKVLHGALAEEKAKHAADVAAAHLVASLPGRLEDAVDELLREAAHLLVGAGLLEGLERLDARRHGQRVAAERASLVHGARGRHVLHDLALAAVGAHGEPPADHLAHGGEVRGDAPVLLRAAVGDAEAGHHLVKHEHRAVLGAQVAEALEELLVRDDEARVAHDGLEDDARDLVLVVLEDGLHGGEVVVARAQRGLGGALGHAGRVGQAEGGHAGARLHEEGVRVAVVAALELDHLVAPRVGPHEPQDAHARLGARVCEPDHLHRGDRLDHLLGEHVLEGRGRAEGGALLQGLLERLQHPVVRVADDGRAPGAHVVDVLVAIHVPRVRALDAVEDHGLAAHGLEGAHGGADAAGHQVLGLREDLV